MKAGPRRPMHAWQPGQVLRLKAPVCGIPGGWFGFLGLKGAIFTVCRLGEDDSGELCRTDETFEVHIDFADAFTPAMGFWRI